jgi:hypothetical protein
MYVGFASRLDPANLPDGILQAAQNVRLQRGIAQPRKGCQRLTEADLNSQVMVGSGVWIDANGQDNVVMVFSDRFYLYRIEQGNTSPTLLGPYMFPSGRGIAGGGVADCVQALFQLIIFRGQYDKTAYSATITNSGIVSGAVGTITVNTSTAHGYSTGDEVTVRHSLDYRAESAIDGNYIITVTSPTQFTFLWTNNSGSNYNQHTNHPGFTAQRGKPPLIWDSNTLTVTAANQKFLPSAATGDPLTYITESIPPGEFGLYFQNRVLVKYGNDQIAVSNVLSFRCDVALNAFIINQGGNDSIVGFLPWIDSQFLVFMQNSIYVAFLDARAFATENDTSQITVVTTQLGCLSRKSIVNAGQYVLFLSAKGVYLLTPQLDLKVIGDTTPLSEAISDVFETMNFQAASKAVSAYYNNRFYIAIPVVTNGVASSRNNRILIFNTLNKNWESIDRYPEGMYIDNLIVASYKYQDRLFIMTNFFGTFQYGGIFLEEERTDGDWYIGENSGITLPFTLPANLNAGATISSIESYVTTREFTMKSLNEKRFSRAEFQFNNIINDVVQIDSTVHDPDSSQTIMSYQFSGNSDGTLRPRVAARGSSVDFTIHFTNGRPALKGVTVYGITANRPMVSQE